MSLTLMIEGVINWPCTLREIFEAADLAAGSYSDACLFCSFQLDEMLDVQLHESCALLGSMSLTWVDNVCKTPMHCVLSVPSV